MLKVLDKLRVEDIYCVSVEGDIQLIKIGLKLIDENGNIFEIKAAGMTHYQNSENIKRRAEIVLCGDVENIGKTLVPSA